MKKLIVLIACIAALQTQFVWGQSSAGQLPLEHIFTAPDIVNVALSPSGKKLAIFDFSVFRYRPWQLLDLQSSR